MIVTLKKGAIYNFQGGMKTKLNLSKKLKVSHL